MEILPSGRCQASDYIRFAEECLGFETTIDNDDELSDAANPPVIDMKSMMSYSIIVGGEFCF